MSSGSIADMKVSGLFLLAQVECMGAFKPFAQKMLADCGVFQVSPDQWYDASALFKLYEDMGKRFGASTIYQIGKSTSEHAPFPPEVKTIEDGLKALCGVYSTHNRGSDPGSVRYVKTGEKSAAMVMRNPYDCDWCRGVVVMAAERFKQPEQLPKVVHDSTKPCRKKGGDECTYLVSW